MGGGSPHPMCQNEFMPAEARKVVQNVQKGHHPASVMLWLEFKACTTNICYILYDYFKLEFKSDMTLTHFLPNSGRICGVYEDPFLKYGLGQLMPFACETVWNKSTARRTPQV